MTSIPIRRNVVFYCYPGTIKAVIDGGEWKDAIIYTTSCKDFLPVEGVLLGEVDARFNVPSRDELIRAAIGAFDAAEQKLRADFQAQLNNVIREKQNFLAITYEEPKPAPEPEPAPAPLAPITEGELTFFVTYGSGTNVSSCYSLVKANTYEEAREKVFAAIGPKFSSMYDVADLQRQRNEYNLTEVPLQPMKAPHSYILHSTQRKEFFFLEFVYEEPVDLVRKYVFWAADVVVVDADAGEDLSHIPLTFEEVNAPEEPEEPGICVACNGSGEGKYDGTTCSTCHGKGVERVKAEEDEEPPFDSLGS